MKLKKVLMLSLLLFPTAVFASSIGDLSLIATSIGMEAFVSIHMSIFVLNPLSKIFSKDNSKKLFWKMFIIRAIVLLILDYFMNITIAVIDFIMVFVGAFIVVPIFSVIEKNKANKNILTLKKDSLTPSVDNQELKCPKCGTILKANAKFCTNCGEPVKTNITIEASSPSKIVVKKNAFDSIYNLLEETMVEEFINREMKKCNIDISSKLMPSAVLKKKKVFNIIFSILIFIFISLIFFHFPIYTYIIGIILLFIFFKATRKYSLMKYLKKELKSRPSEKVSNIIMSVKSEVVEDDSGKVFILSLVIATIIPLLIFIKPRIMYEKMDNGYGVRFYTFGLTNYKSAEIPSSYKGETIISLRGNTFSNMPFLESVKLPDTITEIRGQAFKNDIRLKNVNIPINLEYLGGGAFYKCRSLTSINLPDTLTYMGGETFYGASSLKTVKLSNNLSEIRGDSFEYCTSLTSITIPDNVTRIGGHAFYGDSSLSSVIFTPNSKLNEIGSSAFRLCPRLYSITIPYGAYVNERAFKESPTSINYFGSYDNNYYDNNYDNTYYDNYSY